MCSHSHKLTFTHTSTRTHSQTCSHPLIWACLHIHLHTDILTYTNTLTNSLTHRLACRHTWMHMNTRESHIHMHMNIFIHWLPHTVLPTCLHVPTHLLTVNICKHTNMLMHSLTYEHSEIHSHKQICSFTHAHTLHTYISSQIHPCLHIPLHVNKYKYIHKSHIHSLIHENTFSCTWTRS